MTEPMHVRPAPDGGWDVGREDGRKASAHFATKREAVAQARKLSIARKGKLVVHGRDGHITDVRCYVPRAERRRRKLQPPPFSGTLSDEVIRRAVEEVKERRRQEAKDSG